MLQSAGIVIAAMLVSRILGFFREWTVAHQIGSNATTDAYYAAFTLPDFLSYLVAAGALSIIFIPVFTKFLAENREDKGWHVFSTIITVMTLVMVVIIFCAEIFAPTLVRFISPGFNPSQRAQVIFLTRLMLPAQFFFYLGSVMAAVQNAKGKFLIPALATIVYNVGIIFGGWLLAPRIGVTGFAVGLVAGSFFGYFLLQLIAVQRMGARFIPNLDVNHPGFRLFVRLAIPVMLALSIEFTDTWMMRWFGSYLAPASITWLTYGKTLMSVPLATIGYAVGVASFPFLAQLHSEGKFDDVNRTLNSTVKGLILFLVPISALSIVLSKPVVFFVFSHTRLHMADVLATASALAVFSVGLSARGVQNLVSRGFNAAHDTLTPALVGTSATVLSVPVYWYCARRWNYLGLAGASSFAAITFAIVLFILLVRRTRNRAARGLVVFLVKVSVSSGVSALICSRLAAWLETRIAWQTMTGALVVLCAVTAIGFPLTMLMTRMLGVSEIEVYFKKLLFWTPKRVLAVSE